MAKVNEPNGETGRQHVVSLTRDATVYNWIRMRVTETSSGRRDEDAALELEVRALLP